MGAFSGPKIVEDGLVLALDAGNTKNYNLTAVEVLVVAGGGGGGGRSGGGGGGGGLIYNSNFSITPGSAITVTVGGGGAGGAGSGPPGSDGQNSVFDTLTAIGGGGGGSDSVTAGRSGGSGGGGKYGSVGGSGTSGQGFAGGSGTSGTWKAGGGGGAGSVGVNGSANPHKCGDGGTGLGFYISGTFTYYSGGGGGGSHNSSAGGCCDDSSARGLGGIGGGGDGGTPGGKNSGTNGTANTGGGGGGGSTTSSSGGAGGNGGSGIVIVRYPGPQKAIGGTVTSVNGYTIHTFITTGSTTFTPLAATNNSAILGLSDFSGNNRFATSANGVVYSGDKLGSLSFDGSNDYITVSNVQPNTNNFTISVWVYKNNNTSNDYVWDFGANGGTLSSGTSVSGYGFRYYNATLGTGSNMYTQGPIPNVSEWYEVTITRNSGTSTMYVNGQSITSSSGDTHNISSTTLYIGRYGGGTGYEHDGRISNFKIYNRALTASEIQQNFQALRGRYGI